MTMKEQRFGMELEFTGMTRARAARKLQEVVGGTVHNTGSEHNGWYVTAPDGRNWRIMGDASVQPIRNGAHEAEACEFVTPICTWDDIPTVQECIRRLRRAGAKVNASCGLHVHVDAANHTAQSLKNLVFLWKARQELIFRAVKTQTSRPARWCKPIDEQLVDAIKKMDKKNLDKRHLEDLWYDTYAPGSIRAMHYNQSRYHALNLHSTWQRGTVEFRCFEATLHAGEVRAWIALCLGLSYEAIRKKSIRDNLASENDLYTMNCMMQRMGFKGEEFKSVRQHLTKNLTGYFGSREIPDRTTRAA